MVQSSPVTSTSLLKRLHSPRWIPFRKSELRPARYPEPFYPAAPDPRRPRVQGATLFCATWTRVCLLSDSSRSLDLSSGMRQRDRSRWTWHPPSPRAPRPRPLAPPACRPTRARGRRPRQLHSLPSEPPRRHRKRTVLPSALLRRIERRPPRARPLPPSTGVAPEAPAPSTSP